MATKEEKTSEANNNENDYDDINNMSPDERIAWLRERVSRHKVARFFDGLLMIFFDWICQH
jgi:hypothetical protein